MLPTPRHVSATSPASTASPASAAPAHVCPETRRPYVLGAAILASALGFIDGSVLAIAIPQIRDSLDASFAQAQWVANAYVLLLAALLLLGGAAGDRFGVRRTFGFGIALFTAASLACALVPSAPWLIAARVVQGAGAAVMVPCSLALIARNYPRADRGRAIGLWSSASALMTTAGPVLGGLVLTWGDDAWRWVFAINLPLGALALLILRRVPDDPGTHGEPLDAIGATLATVALGTFALGLTLLGGEAIVLPAGPSNPWALMGVGLALAAAFAWWEGRAAHPMVRLSLFRSRAFSGANAATLALYAALGGFLFFAPMQIIVGWGLSELYASLVFLPMGLLIAALSPPAGRWADRHGPRLPLTLGPAIVGAGLLAVAWANHGAGGGAGAERDFWFALLPAVALVGVGLGLTVSPLSSAVMLAVDDSASGTASGVNNMVARMANLFAIAGLGALAATAYEASVATSGLAPAARESLAAAGFGERLDGALFTARNVEAQSAAMTAAFMRVVLATAALAFAAALLGWWTQGRPRAERS